MRQATAEADYRSTGWRRKLRSLLLVQVLLTSGLSIADPAASQEDARRALEALFSATNGDNWTTNSGWIDDPVCDGSLPNRSSVYGVLCDDNTITWLDLKCNGLSGSLPDVFDLLEGLRGLDLSNDKADCETPNTLSGEVPPSLWRRRSLRWFRLGGNSLSGQVPPIRDSLHLLNMLDLGSNRFSGPLPDLSGMPELRFIWLQENEFTGDLSGLGTTQLSPTVVQLRLSDNHLTGAPPREWMELPNLRFLHLASNKLSGAIPTELLGSSKDLYIDNQTFHWNMLTAEPEVWDWLYEENPWAEASQLHAPQFVGVREPGKPLFARILGAGDQHIQPRLSRQAPWPILGLWT